MQDPTPLRPAFWNVPLWAEIGVYIVGIAALIVCIAGIVRSVRLRRGKTADIALKEPNARFLYAIKEIFLQKKIRETAPGLNHFVLFWGFVFLFLGTAIATVDWDIAHLIFNKRILAGNTYLVYKFVLDAAGIAALIALVIAAWRRFVRRDKRVEANSRFALVLGSLAFIILTGFLLESLRLATQKPDWAWVSFAGNTLAQLFSSCDAAFIETLHTYVWVVHGLASLGFVALAPLTYYAHLFKTPTSIYVKKAPPMGAIPKIEDIEEQERFGISEFDQFDRIDRIRFDGCTECGRCRDNCPAVAAETPLDPKNLVLALQTCMHGKGSDKELVGDIIPTEALWSCTSCGACTKACPAQIPIHELIVGMRRHLALEEGQFPNGLAQALENTASVGNPWGMDPGSRLNWAKGLDVEVAREGVKYDVLYWVGCSASYDKRAQKIARAMVTIMKAAGVNFAVMREERCHGEFARRAGEEYLYQTAATENIENFSKYSFGEIVASCPHCFNTLKNEYSQFEGGKFAVTSHVQLIARLLREGKISAKLARTADFTIHDACYLARYNGIGRDPREVLAGIGAKVREAEHCGCHAMCCGAGGAQIFMDRPARINILRLEELNRTQTGEIAVSCPHCLTMITSAQAQSIKRDEAPKPVSDLAEIVARAIEQNSEKSDKTSGD